MFNNASTSFWNIAYIFPGFSHAVSNIIGEAMCMYIQCGLWACASCGELGTEIESEHPETL